MKSLLFKSEIKKSLLILMLFSLTISKAQVVTETFSSTSTFTVPIGVTQVFVEAWGAGGKGGTINGIGYGGGGGGGAYSSALVNVVSGNSYAVNVGAGATTTSAGGDSWFGSVSTVLAKGGNSVSNNTITGATGGSATSSVGTTKYSGGNGANGSAILIFGGGGGSSAGSANTGTTATNNNGAVAPSGGGNGGNGAALIGSGSPGLTPGGGGGGAYGIILSLFTGGNGANGRVKLTYILVPEIAVMGNGNVIADGDVLPTNADWTDFGVTTGAVCSLSREFTISNNAVGNLAIGSVTISGANASEFSIISLPSSNVVYGSSTTFIVTFLPTSNGVKNAEISIVNNDSDENPYNFVISAIANNPEINLVGNSKTIVSGDLTPSKSDWTDFGTTEITVSTISKTFTIQNTGNSNLTLSNPIISGLNSSDFSITSSPSLTVVAGSSTTFTVAFNPSAVGVRTASISIANIDCNESNYSFSIKGNGALYTNGPGGVVADLQLWLRADLIDGTTTKTDNSNVSTWFTQAGGSNADKPGSVGSPIYKNNAVSNLNFNAVVDFTNDYNATTQTYAEGDSSRQYLKGASGFYSNDMFVVVVPDVCVTSNLPSMAIFCGDQNEGVDETDASGIGYGDYTSRMTNELLAYGLGTSAKYGIGEISTTNTYSKTGIINARNNSGNTGMQLYFNDNNVASTEVNSSTYDNISDSQYWIGRNKAWDGSLDGRIAEIITFSSRKSDTTERNKIESYLGIKYGITLGVNGTSQNYIGSDGTILWDATANAGYNYDIAGIGRDDISKLNQKQSKSVNANVTIGLGTIAATNTANTNAFDVDKKYLIWGDNGGNMNDSETDLTITFGGTSNVTTLTDLPNKKWKIVETGGDVATTKVAIPTTAFASLPALAGNDAYVMIVSSDAAFTSGLETIFLTTNGANQETDYDFDGTKFFTFGVAHESIYSRHSTYDGVDDIMKVGNTNNLNSTFSMMTWVRPTGANTLANDRTIVSKYNGTTGFRVYLSTTNRVVVTWAGGTTLTSTTALPSSEWHNIAIIYSGGSIKLYIDGVLDSTVASAAPASSTNTFSIGAEYRSKSDTRNFFKGDIDEFRLWDKAITLTELKFVMNQEILQNGTGTKGVILPTTITKNDISTLNWSNLQAYYSMNSFIGTHINDDSQNSNRGNVFLPNKTTITVQSSPQPYESSTDGAWSSTSTWSNGTIQQLPNSISIVDGITPIDWNIVKTNNNVGSTGNKTVLGLLVTANTLSATNDTKIEISHYLKLDGKIDLVGKSQLLQTNNSDLDVTSAGSIERDQQGQSNTYNYNYWSSPVSTINNSTVNHGFTVADVMKDGTNVNNIQSLQWSGGIDGAATSPITIASYWIFKFQNYTNDYANWSGVGPYGTLLAGQGYTMKGSNAATANQNYTFAGKPNNGTITSAVSANNLNLCGNPFASAIDADKFIDDNVASITGTLYFWEHYSTNNSHVTMQYQGGYATYTKVGGTAPVAPAGVSGLGSSSKTAKRFIPVGQGFFVTGSVTGGTITFNNSQRLFVKEDNASSYTLFRNSNSPVVNTDSDFNNSEDTFSESQFMKLRLGYNSADNFHREILLGFMNENATADFDNGYDALSIEDLTNDMYFLNGETKLNIQGDGYFNVNNIYPLGVKNETEGTVKFGIKNKENFDESQDIFIYDNETQIYHDIKSEDFEISLPAGTFDTRFSLRFLNPTALGTDENVLQHGIGVTHSQVNNVLNIKNELQEVNVKSVSLYNLLGQEVQIWKVYNQNQTDMQLRISDLSSGTYIVKVITDSGDVTKKIIIK